MYAKKIFQRHWVIAFISFILGIAIQSQLKINNGWSISGSFIFYLLGIVLLAQNKIYFFEQQKIAIFLIFLGLGTFTYSLHPYPDQGDELFQYVCNQPPNSTIELIGVVVETDLFNPQKQSMNIVLNVLSIKDNHKNWNRIQGKSLVHIKNIQDPIFTHSYIHLTGKASSYLSAVNPRIRSYEDYLRTRRIYTHINTTANNIKIVKTNIFSLLYWISRLQQFIFQQIQTYSPPTTQGLIQALWLGDRSALSYEEKQNFINTGTLHILAISGLHIGLIYWIAQLMIQSFRFKYRFVPSVFALTLCLFYAIITGLHGSSLRALLMLTIFEIYQGSRKNPDLLSSLCLSGILLFGLNPDWFWDWGTQMSFVSIASILLYQEAISKGLQFLPFGLNNYLSITISAQILLIPFLSVFNSPINLISFIINLLVIPLVSLFLWFSMIGVFLIFVPLIPHFFFYLSSIYILLIERICAKVAKFSFSQLLIPTPTYTGIILFIALIYVFHVFITTKQKRYLYLSLIFILGIFFTWSGLFFDKSGEVVFLDVGHGDAIFIRTPEKKTILIDAGTQYHGETTLLPFLNSYGLKRIDYAIATHADEDHVGGFIPLLKNKKISCFLFGENFDNQSLGAEIIKLAKKHNTEVRKISKGNKIQFLNSYFDIKYAGNPKYTETNSNSLVVLYVYKNFSILLTGDFPVELHQTEISEANLNTTILKLSHHGLRNSVTETFLEQVQPQLALASCNEFKRNWGVRKEIKELLKNKNIPLLRTDYLGGIQIRFYPTHFSVHSARLQRGYELGYNSSPNFKDAGYFSLR